MSLSVRHQWLVRQWGEITCEKPEDYRTIASLSMSYPPPSSPLLFRLVCHKQNLFSVPTSLCNNNPAFFPKTVSSAWQAPERKSYSNHVSDTASFESALTHPSSLQIFKFAPHCLENIKITGQVMQQAMIVNKIILQVSSVWYTNIDMACNLKKNTICQRGKKSTVF